LRQRTEKPLALEFVFRFTLASLEFRFRFQADVPDGDDDQMFVFTERLLKVPSVFRLPGPLFVGFW